MRETRTENTCGVCGEISKSERPHALCDTVQHSSHLWLKFRYTAGAALDMLEKPTQSLEFHVTSTEYSGAAIDLLGVGRALQMGVQCHNGAKCLVAKDAFPSVTVLRLLSCLRINDLL